MPKPQTHEVKLQRLPSLSCVQASREIAVGMESLDIPDDRITALSTANYSVPSLARLNCKEGGWSARSALKDSYIQIDLGSLYDVTGVATQGGGETRGDFVKAYKLQFSLDEKDWEYYLDIDNYNQILAANNDCSSVARQTLKHSVRARFVRLWPVEWFHWPTMRLEIYGVPVGKATYETSITITDIHGYGIDGCPTLQFSLQLFGENGFTKRIPLEIRATEQDKDSTDTLLYKRKVIANDVGWVKHIKVTYENGSLTSNEARPTLAQRLRRMSSSSSSDSIHQESGFFVEELGIDIAETGQHFTFPCKQWLLQATTAFDATHRHKSRVASSVSNTTIGDEDFEHILLQEGEDTAEDWKPCKAPTGIQSWRREPKKTETTQLTKTVFDLEGIPYEHAIQLMCDWDLRKKWDQTFEKVIILEDDGESNVLYCCMKMPRLFRMWDLLITTMDKRYNDDSPCHVTAWCSTEHSSVSEEGSATLKRLNVRLSGLVIRPKGDGTQSSRATLLTRMKVNEDTAWPLKQTYLNGHPAHWIKNLHEYYTKHGVEKNSESENTDVF